MTVEYQFDGGGSHNGSPAGWGWACAVHGVESAHGCGALPPGTTNNEAEYTGLIMALKHAIVHSWPSGATYVFRGDSQLVVEQMNGRYRVKAANLRPYHERALYALETLDAVVEWHPRLRNARADMLATQGRERWREPRSSKVWARGTTKSS